MARTPDKNKPGSSGSEEAPPSSYAQTAPEFGQVGHDFTLQAVMQLQKTVGEFGAKIDGIRDEIKGHGTKLDDIERIVDRVKTGAIVAGAILSIVGVVFWWAIGDRITNAVRSALSNPPAAMTVLPPPK